MGTIAETLADWVAGLRPGDVPPSVVRQAKRCLVDVVGVALAGTAGEATRMVRDHAAREFAPGPCTVLGGTPMSPSGAALANAVAALAAYGKPGAPVIVVDFGTATTFDALSAAGEYLGGVICPGVEISADALFQRAARLPRVDVRRPNELIGRTTVTSMQSGLFFGYVAMVEGMVERLACEMSDRGRVVTVATGGLALEVTAETDVIDHVDANLTLMGLRLVWERNQGV